MEPALIVILCFFVGVLILVAEIFIPSHGILSIAGVGFMVYAIYRAYADLSNAAGHATVAATLVALPTLAAVAVKTFHRTPWGRKISPPNPVVRVEDFAPHLEALKRYVGQSGRTVTPLRPVGTGMFNGARLDCVAESGMIDRDVDIEAVGIRGHELEVRPLLRT